MLELMPLRSSHLQYDDEFEEIIANPTSTLPSAKEIVESLERLTSAPRPDPTTFVSPLLWTPNNQNDQLNVLQKTASSLIKEIQAQKIDLRSLHWRQFEEIVAEILRATGMEIYINKNVPQGGRDIFARGHLVPGSELITIAIEVKHREYVDRPEIQKALHQNRAFPALLFVTSGSFSAGVIREAELPEYRMRLFLKDGVAVRDLIKCYSLKPQC